MQALSKTPLRHRDSFVQRPTSERWEELMPRFFGVAVTSIETSATNPRRSHPPWDQSHEGVRTGKTVAVTWYTASLNIAFNFVACIQKANCLTTPDTSLTAPTPCPVPYERQSRFRPQPKNARPATDGFNTILRPMNCLEKKLLPPHA